MTEQLSEIQNITKTTKHKNKNNRSMIKK